MQNPAGESTNKSPSSSPDKHSPADTLDPTQNTGRGNIATAEGGGSENLGNPLQVVDLESGDGGHIGYSRSPVAAAVGEGGSSVALAVEKRGIDQKTTVEDGSSSGGRRQKRKASQPSDPPPGTPTCPVCGKEFPSWKSAFGHMRAHPDRDYRGFYRPPVFSSSSSSPTRQRVDQVAGESGEEQQRGEKGPSPTRGLAFDLNQPVEGVGSSEAAERSEAPESSAAEKTDEEKKNVGFDLNELPPAEDDEDKP